jgi:hypothetical protein
MSYPPGTLSLTRETKYQSRREPNRKVYHHRIEPNPNFNRFSIKVARIFDSVCDHDRNVPLPLLDSLSYK